MSYTTKIKEEISSINNTESEIIAELAGFIRNNALFTEERKAIHAVLPDIISITMQNIKSFKCSDGGLSYYEKYTPHKLRHTAATLMYKYGNVDIRALQELLGHESISTTEIYTHVDNEQIRSAVENNPLADL